MLEEKNYGMKKFQNKTHIILQKILKIYNIQYTEG